MESRSPSDRSWTTASPNPAAASWHDLTDLGKPQGISPELANKLGRDLFGIPVLSCKQLPGERDLNFLLCTKAAEGGGKEAPAPRYVLKLCNLTESREVVEMQSAAFRHLAAHGIPSPSTVQSLNLSDMEVVQDSIGQDVLVRCVTYVPGKLMVDVKHDDDFLQGLGEFVGLMDKALESFWHPAAHRYMVWDLAYGLATVNNNLCHVSDESRRNLIVRCIERYEAVGGTQRVKRLRKAVVHNDANDHNVVVEETGSFFKKKSKAVAAVIDFGDMVYTELVNNVAITLAYAMLAKPQPMSAAAQVLAGYHAQNPLESDEMEVLLPLVTLRLCTSCVLAACSSSLDPDNEYLLVSEKPAWDLLQKLDSTSAEQWMKVMRAACDAAGQGARAPSVSTPEKGPRPADESPTRGCSQRQTTALTSPVTGRAPATSRCLGMPTDEILRLRAKHVAPSFSTSYASSPSGPIHMVRGVGCRLWDARGLQYLDCVNNVSHVGHAHPRVTQAASEQLALLNTNTRYLSQSLVEYAKALTETMGGGLEVCFFCCTGSEANDLALRLAKAATSPASEVVVMGSAYHGHTTALIELSPYKFEGKGGAGKMPHVHIIPAPDDLRGRHLDPAEEAVKIVQQAEGRGTGIAAFFCESVLGCAGQVVLPPGYLSTVYAHMRAAGAVCVADEVQTGFGRVGTHFWGYQTQNVQPDIVTLGKPMGNGLPVAAVVTTALIASKFNNGMEYFNTFGGTNLSTAVGLEVLHIIKDEHLQENARAVGERLLSGLQQLADKFPCLGHVRGMGLFLGVEVVLEGMAGAPPAGHLAEWIACQMRERRVLVSTDGPAHNVLKIKPPMCFSMQDAAWFLGALGSVLMDQLDPSTYNRLFQQDLLEHQRSRSTVSEDEQRLTTQGHSTLPNVSSIDSLTNIISVAASGNIGTYVPCQPFTYVVAAGVTAAVAMSCILISRSFK